MRTLGKGRLIIHAINMLSHGCKCNMDLFFSFFYFPYLFGTRASRSCNKWKNKKTRKINHILHLHPYDK